MLQFWKKTGHDKNLRSASSCTSKNTCVYTQEKVSPNVYKSESTTTKVLPLASLDDEGLFDIEYESSKEKSRLSKTLQEIISDKCALNYFLQYMESRQASPYILCWLDIEKFKSDLHNSVQSVKKHSNSPMPNGEVDHDSLSVSTDCDSYTADSNSLCDYSTNTLSEVKTHENFCDRDNSDNSCRLNSLSEEYSEQKNGQSTVDSALDIFKKYVAQESVLNIRCSEELRREIMENICNTEKLRSGYCFDSVQSYIYNIMEDEYFSAFLTTDFFCKHQIDVLTSGKVILDDILYNETALFYFMEFLEQENQCNLLEFWIAASNFQLQLHDQKHFLDTMEAQNDAIILYDKYFSLQAHCPLGFSDNVRCAVEQNICSENGVIIACFHLPVKIVERVLEKNYLKPFLASQLFYKYLSDLINTVQSYGYSTSIERTSSSDCSSEKSFGQSPFLAFEVPNNFLINDERGTAMTIDTRELYDPDSLWKRRKCHRLSLGHVSELGKYETEFEPEPDRKEFQFKNVLKKVINSDEENKKKEEMAWQVAEMIVKDIMKITLNDQKKY